MQAILTKVIPCTNTKPTRIKASCARGSLIGTNWPQSLAVSDAAAHAHVARLLCAKFVAEDLKQYGAPQTLNPWGGKFVTGCLPSGDFAHVFTGK
jgi:hypothetical protein